MITHEELGEHGPQHEFLKHLHDLQSKKLCLLHIELELSDHPFHFLTCAKAAQNLSELSMLYVGSRLRSAFVLFGFGDADMALVSSAARKDGLASSKAHDIQSGNPEARLVPVEWSNVRLYTFWIAVEPLFRDQRRGIFWRGS
ncbi:hypothetical protein Moror_13008 [Moniliophthora roreri MCA 2997]|uniref:Uncharacterized protein n=1 Tax=Moniliophthora roreri (strain MCA 2997) TaxID=1381753 RepID=V2XM17_MONRO|nr:hypothetical protein Moror_13008 [Moniliophthora roreri MCA 2997]